MVAIVLIDDLPSLTSQGDKRVSGDGIPQLVLDVMEMALEISRDVRKGREFGTIFVVGDTDRVLENSFSLILDPLKGHPPEDRSIYNEQLRGTLKELAKLDGSFIVDERGVVVSAARYLDVSARGMDFQFGIGSRHIAGMAITRVTDAYAVVISINGVINTYHHGKCIDEVHPVIVQ